MSSFVWTLYNNETEEVLENLDLAGSLAALSLCSTDELKAWFAWQPEMLDWSPVLQLPEFKPLHQTAHIYWMPEGSDGAPAPTDLSELTLTSTYVPPVSPALPAESEELAAQAESMPEPTADHATEPAADHAAEPAADHAAEPAADHSYVAKIETPQRMASFPLATATEPSISERRKYPRFQIRYRVIIRNDNLTFRTFSQNISLGGLALETPVPQAFLGSDCQIFVGNTRTGENIRFSGRMVANRKDAQFFMFIQASPESLSKLQKWVESHIPQTKKAV